jgi:hypothetical protein
MRRNDLSKAIIINSWVKQEFGNLLETEGFKLISELQNNLYYKSSNVAIEFKYHWRDGFDFNLLTGNKIISLFVILGAISIHKKINVKGVTDTTFPLSVEETEEKISKLAKFLISEGKPLLKAEENLIEEASKIKHWLYCEYMGIFELWTHKRLVKRFIMHLDRYNSRHPQIED